MTPARLVPTALFALLALGACTLDSQEYENLKSLRDEYRAQIADLRQANETINRNILATYMELESLEARLAEEEEAKRRSG
jgi:predicted  nucleic acid-binding Zn-ribbon protein